MVELRGASIKFRLTASGAKRPVMPNNISRLIAAVAPTAKFPTAQNCSQASSAAVRGSIPSRVGFDLVAS
jgi:hypothetical protein